MTGYIRSNRGFYTLEAVIVLPIVILAVLSVGYYIRIDSVWENVMHCALDESSYSSSKAYGHLTELDSLPKIKRRVLKENPQLMYFRFTGAADRYSDKYSSELTSYSFKGTMSVSLPAGFDRTVDFHGGIKYRGFRGKRYDAHGMGSEGLENDEIQDPVWIFPQSGVRYHGKKCTYVRATVHGCYLTNSIKRRFKPCDMCNSDELPIGSLVFCFQGADTAYHRGDCRCITRHTAVIDRSEAEEKGYSPCTKCGGQ